MEGFCQREDNLTAQVLFSKFSASLAARGGGLALAVGIPVGHHSGAGLTMTISEIIGTNVGIAVIPRSGG